MAAGIREFSFRRPDEAGPQQGRAQFGEREIRLTSPVSSEIVYRLCEARGRRPGLVLPKAPGTRRITATLCHDYPRVHCVPLPNTSIRAGGTLDLADFETDHRATRGVA